MSATPKWTPGPWRLVWHGNEAYPYPLSIETGDGVCWIARDGVVSSEADARLIAAAPALYEALERARLFVPAEELAPIDAALDAARGEVTP